MGDLVKRFWSFDRLLGVDLVKLIYYVGLLGIVAFVAIGMMMGVVTMMSDPVAGLIQIIACPIVGAVVIVYWRFACELFMVAFQMNERIGDLRDYVKGVPPAADPNAPQF